MERKRNVGETGESIPLQLVSSFTGLDSTKQENMLRWVFSGLSLKQCLLLPINYLIKVCQRQKVEIYNEIKH